MRSGEKANIYSASEQHHTHGFVESSPHSHKRIPPARQKKADLLVKPKVRFTMDR
jgi:hypothetical protein